MAEKVEDFIGSEGAVLLPLLEIQVGEYPGGLGLVLFSLRCSSRQFLSSELRSHVWAFAGRRKQIL